MPPRAPGPSRPVWNFCILSLYQIVMRLGWIFKTETIVMPAVLDLLGGSAMLRGCLPMFSRLGLALPPLVAAPHLRRTRFKKRAVALCALAMGLQFLLLAWLWSLRESLAVWQRPLAFLGLYTLFFVFTGLHQLSFGTLQGKVIPITYRGRLMLAANLTGATVAIVAVICLMPQWLRPDGGDFDLMFSLVAVCFVLCGCVALTVAEPPDHADRDCEPWQPFWQEAFSAIRHDGNLRYTIGVTMLASCSLMVFPHYQALGRTRLELDFNDLMIWVVVQNIGTACFSVLAGPIADRHGNRLVLRTLVAGLAVIPLVALLVSYQTPDEAALFGAIFWLLGLMPVTLRILQNYVLEIASLDQQPTYLSIVSAAAAMPLLLSPLVGELIDQAGFDAPFVGVAVLVLLGWLLTFQLDEPRHR